MSSLVVCLCVFGVFGWGTACVSAEEHLPSSKCPTRCNVTGGWRSSLGSMLLLTSSGAELKGVYHTAVETVPGAAGQNREAKLVGLVGDGPQPTVAFAVLWVKGSCSAWVGQCFVLPGGDQVLKTSWMLRSAVESSSENWGSTRLGEDQFIFVGNVENDIGC